MTDINHNQAQTEHSFLSIIDSIKEYFSSDEQLNGNIVVPLIIEDYSSKSIQLSLLKSSNGIYLLSDSQFSVVCLFMKSFPFEIKDVKDKYIHISSYRYNIIAYDRNIDNGEEVKVSRRVILEIYDYSLVYNPNASSGGENSLYNEYAIIESTTMNINENEEIKNLTYKIMNKKAFLQRETNEKSLITNDQCHAIEVYKIIKDLPCFLYKIDKFLNFQNEKEIFNEIILFYNKNLDFLSKDDDHEIFIDVSTLKDIYNKRNFEDKNKFSSDENTHADYQNKFPSWVVELNKKVENSKISLVISEKYRFIRKYNQEFYKGGSNNIK